jgi:hypothetical protein
MKTLGSCLKTLVKHQGRLRTTPDYQKYSSVALGVDIFIALKALYF